MSGKVLVIKVHGMTCQGCVNNLTNALKSVKGVKDVYVALEKKKVTVRSDAEQSDEGKVKNAIKEAGYEVP